MTTVNVSMNEYFSLVKRTFEGLGYCCGDYEDAASASLWLESRGLHGLDVVRRTVDRSASANSSLDVLSKTAGEYVIDAGNASIVVCGYRIAELAICTALQHGRCHIEVRNCRERDAIVAAIASSSRNTIAMLAHWRSDHKGQLSVALPHELFPSLHQSSPDLTEADSGSTLYLFGDRDAEKIRKLAARIASDSGSQIELAPQSKLESALADATEHGLSVDALTWNKLLLAADNILVESTEQSRKGAGES